MDTDQSSVIRLAQHTRKVNHQLCQECPKNGVTCMDEDETCLAVEMLVQICLEPRTMAKLEMIDNASELLDLKNSFKG